MMEFKDIKMVKIHDHVGTSRGDNSAKIKNNYWSEESQFLLNFKINFHVQNKPVKIVFFHI